MRFLRPAFYILDAIAIGLVLSLPALWLMGRIRAELGPVGFSMSWGPRPFVALAVLVVLRSVTASRLRSRGLECRAWLGRAWIKKVLLSLAVLIAVLPLMDLVLSAKGYERNALPIVMQGDEDWTDADARFESDARLLWRFKHGTSIHGQSVNTLGFPEREVDPRKRPDTTRVICLGDSCTADGVPPYSSILHELLTNAPPAAGSWEALHNGVHGYSILQGVEQFRHTTVGLQPDIVTIYFGWNAHWRGEQTDAEQFATRGAGPILSALRRLYRSSSRPDQARPLRVPSSQYTNALTTLVREIRAEGIIPIIITAPRAEHLSSVIADRQGNPLDEIHELHDHYAALTRSVASAEQVILIDAARLVETHPGRHEFFRADGIHLRLAGRRKMAELIYRTIRHGAKHRAVGLPDARLMLPLLHEVWADDDLPGARR
ncbi:MAG: SGNH/GDSL hydrolase family protein [Verrucomicrobia bacterium]|nr:SGNH/GDSL hydrolase family protein [Verrucomicrobiota bacterium]MDA1087207.1 SGNH/GDSL hydrolase family protein [Verrucomicrobiota bacterium]